MKRKKREIEKQIDREIQRCRDIETETDGETKRQRA